MYKQMYIAMSFLLKLLIRKMKFKIVLDNIMYKKIIYYW